MIIEVNEYKKKISGYDPKKSELFHSQSAKLADKDFILALKSKKYKRIIFMAGGTASGKTEYAVSYLKKRDQLVYDGTLKNFDGLKIKLQNIKRFDKNNSKIKVVLIVPENIIQSFGAFISRERKMGNKTFFDTHIRSKLSVSKILLNIKIRVEIYASKINSDSGRLEYIRLKLGRRSEASKDLLSVARALHQFAIRAGLALDIDIDSI